MRELADEDGVAAVRPREDASCWGDLPELERRTAMPEVERTSGLVVRDFSMARKTGEFACRPVLAEKTD